MTHQTNYTFSKEIMEQGLEAIPEMMRIIINKAMQEERAQYIQAEEYERTAERKRTCQWI